jgi:hypothetical protein
MKKTIGFLTIIVAIVGVLFYWWTHKTPDTKVIMPMEAPVPPSAESKPAIRYPVRIDNDEALVPGPLPSLDESDPLVSQALSKLVGKYWLEEVFRLQEMIRHIVVTIDNLPRASVAIRLLPTKPVDGNFMIAGAGESLTIAPENARRYKSFVQVVDMINARDWVATYVQFYPLFQQAYQDLGYPHEYFNDRLIFVIDHLLAGPEVSSPVKLLQPHVLYKFADPELERASAGHKIMIRMGSENAQKIKAKLREIRRELIAASVEQ